MKYRIFALSFLCLFCCSLIRAEGDEMKAETKIALPEPKTTGRMTLEEAIYKRRSIRSFASKELSLEQISQLLWAAQGITDTGMGFRTAPSAGALYPLELYIVKKDGFFHYHPMGHILEKAGDRDVRNEIVRTALGQSFIGQAPVSVIISVVKSRVTDKYSSRGNRYVDIEVGHAAENLQLQAVTLGLGSVAIGAFTDSEVKSILGLPEDTEPRYIIPVGYAN